MVRRMADIADELRDRAQELRARIAHIEGRLADPLSADGPDRAIELELDDALDSVEVELLKELREIDAALARFAAGTYGLCTACGEPIDLARLEALPTARRCMACEAE